MSWNFVLNCDKNKIHICFTAGNAMIQKKSNEKLAVKVLDFGLASRFESQNGLDYRGFKSDISEVLRMFSALYTGGLEFNNAYDIQKNWRQEIANVSKTITVLASTHRTNF